MSHEHKYGPIVNNWSLSPQEYAAAMGAAPAAKWYVDLCHRIEREQAEESRRAALQGSFAAWRGPPQPNLRHNPLPPDLDARELEQARGVTVESLTDAVNTLAGAFGLAAEHAREMMDAITRASQIPADLLFGWPPTSLGHTVIPDAPAWSVEYQAVPTDSPAAVPNDVAAHVSQTIAAQFAAVDAENRVPRRLPDTEISALVSDGLRDFVSQKDSK